MDLVLLKQILGGRNLYLIGMMGSGKSVTGPPLAQMLGYGFVDSDQVIEKVSKKSINTIFQNEGENHFREIETKVIQEIGKHYALVVSTGGGVITRSENWGTLHQGVVIWLDPGRERLWQRLNSHQADRPLLNKTSPLIEFDRLLKARYDLYKEADLHISVEDETPEDIALLITQKLPGILNCSENQDEQHTTGH